MAKSIGILFLLLEWGWYSALLTAGGACPGHVFQGKLRVAAIAPIPYFLVFCGYSLDLPIYHAENGKHLQIASGNVAGRKVFLLI